MRRFELHRDRDPSGISGLGVVAQGVTFDDGTAAVRWLTERATTVVYDDAGDLEAIHGHGGATRIVYLDDEPPPRPRPLIEVLGGYTENES